MLMKLNNKNINTFGKYFLMVLAALMIYRMVMPAVEGWRLRDQNYDCNIIKAKDDLQLAAILGENAKKVRLCEDGNYTIINKLKLPGKSYTSMDVPNGPSGCRSKCDNDGKCFGFVYNPKRKMCDFYKKAGPKDTLEYEKGSISFIKGINK